MRLAFHILSMSDKEAEDIANEAFTILSSPKLSSPSSSMNIFFSSSLRDEISSSIFALIVITSASSFFAYSNL